MHLHDRRNCSHQRARLSNKVFRSFPLPPSFSGALGSWLKFCVPNTIFCYNSACHYYTILYSVASRGFVLFAVCACTRVQPLLYSVVVVDLVLNTGWEENIKSYTILVGDLINCFSINVSLFMISSKASSF